MKHLRGVITLTLASTLALTACASGSSGETPAQTPSAATPVHGGEMSFSLSTDTRNFDPAIIPNLEFGTETTRMLPIYGTLFWVDASGEVHPGIGESMSPNDDGSIWTVKLREGVTFTDGTPFNAEAVVFNWERLQNPETASTVSSMIAGMTFEATDELTVTVSLDEPNFFFDNVVANYLMFIVSPTAIKDDPEWATNNPVGAGPFMLSEWVPGSHTSYTRNPDYFDDGKPYLDTVVLKTVPDASQSLQSVISGEIDVTNVATADFAKRAADAGLGTAPFESTGGVVMLMNNSVAPFDDVRARQAMAYAISTDALAAAMDPGLGSDGGLHGIFPESSPFFDSDATLPSPDAEKAQELFDELAADGKPFSVTWKTWGAQPSHQRGAQYLEAVLSEYDNVDFQIEIVDIGALYMSVFVQRDYEGSFRPGKFSITGLQPGLDSESCRV